MNIILTGILLISVLVTGCVVNKAMVAEPQEPAPPSLTMIHQIDSFNPEVACGQALEVISNNPYEQELFENIFARVVGQCQNSKSKDNADIIWNHLVVPLKQSGKVPPDLAKTTWNCYFSRQFISLPSMAPVTHYCQRLTDIKKDLEKEYQAKKLGFEICDQGSPEDHFLNAMYVYNTMWAACHGTE